MNRRVFFSLWWGRLEIPWRVRETAFGDLKPTDSELTALADELAKDFGITPIVLRSKTNTRNVAQARQEIMYELRARTGASYPAIGHAVNRDHTTVMFGVEKVRQRRGLPRRPTFHEF